MGDIVELGRKTMEAAIIVAGPILITTLVVSIVINVLQVLTSIQDSTVSTVPRLFVTAAATIALMPWMFRRLSMFTVQIFKDFPALVR